MRKLLTLIFRRHIFFLLLSLLHLQIFFFRLFFLLSQNLFPINSSLFEPVFFLKVVTDHFKYSYLTMETMSVSSIRSEINRAVEEQLQRTLANIRRGADAETQIRELMNVIHNEWMLRAVQYAKQHEENSKRVNEEFERKLEAVRAENISLRQNHSAQLHVIRSMMAAHLMFAQLHPERLIELCGGFCSVLDAMIEQHEDVEISRNLQDDVNLKVAKILQEKSAEIASSQGQTIREYLDNHLCSRNFPQSSKNMNEISNEIMKLKNLLHQIQSSIIYLTPEHWDQETAKSMANLKSDLRETTGNLLQLLEETETDHKHKVDKKFILKICQ